MHQKLYKYISLSVFSTHSATSLHRNNESLEGFKNKATHFSILQAVQYIRTLTYTYSLNISDRLTQRFGIKQNLVFHYICKQHKVCMKNKYYLIFQIKIPKIKSYILYFSSNLQHSNGQLLEEDRNGGNGESLMLLLSLTNVSTVYH